MSTKTIKKISSGRIKPGEVRNPNGRPRRGESMAECVRAQLETGMKDKYLPTSTMDLLIMKQVEAAEKGDLQALRCLADRGWGQPKQTIDQTIERREPIEEIEITVTRNETKIQP